MLGPAGGDEDSVFFPRKPVAKGQSRPPQGGKTGLDGYDIVITGGPEVTAGDLDDRKTQPFFFDRSIGGTDLAQQLCPADLEPLEIVGIVSDPHLVRVAIDDTV